jgi:phosphoenolpyruvate-protein kinase (PTS system EI component)
VAEGDFVIVDAAEGVVRVRPDDIVRAQYRDARDDELAQSQNTDWVDEPACTADGEALYVTASCGNLPDVERAGGLRMAGVGLYRTELLFLIERETPSLDALIAHYRSVLEPLGDASVTFRLLDVDSSAEMTAIHPEREPNPSLGLFGVRALLAHQTILRRQLQAILRAAGETSGASSIRIAVPKVVDCGDLRKIKEILFEERFALKKSGLVYRDAISVGVVIETPAAVLGIEDLLAEADFALVSLDSLQQYLLAADRANAELAPTFERLHPFVVRALRSIQKAAKQADKHCAIFGVTATQRENLDLLLGVGFRHFSVAPTNLHLFLRNVRAIDLKQAVKSADVAQRASCPAEVHPLSRRR